MQVDFSFGKYIFQKPPGTFAAKAGTAKYQLMQNQSVLNFNT